MIEPIAPTLQSLLIEQSVSAKQAQTLETQVIEQYKNNQLPYHNIDHIYQTLHTAQSLIKDDATQINRSALFIAIWFHDIIYNPQASDNEEASARYAQEKLSLLEVESSLIKLISALILDTKHHQPSTATGKIIIDADLAILGSTPEIYQAYAAAIRQEYSWVPEEAYRNGRAQVLHKFLQRDAIYHSKEAKNRWEATARQNLHQEIEQLTR